MKVPFAQIDELMLVVQASLSSAARQQRCGCDDLFFSKYADAMIVPKLLFFHKQLILFLINLHKIIYFLQWPCMTARGTVADTDDPHSYSPSPTHSRKSRFVAVVFFLLFSCLAVASLYNLGPWTVPAVRIASSPSLSVSTPLQTGTKEPAVLNNETVTETTTETAMPPGKYSIG